MKTTIIIIIITKRQCCTTVVVVIKYIHTHAKKMKQKAKSVYQHSFLTEEVTKCWTSLAETNIGRRQRCFVPQTGRRCKSLKSCLVNFEKPSQCNDVAERWECLVCSSNNNKRERGEKERDLFLGCCSMHRFNLDDGQETKRTTRPKDNVTWGMKRKLKRLKLVVVLCVPPTHPNEKGKGSSFGLDPSTLQPGQSNYWNNSSATELDKNERREKTFCFWFLFKPQIG